MHRIKRGEHFDIELELDAPPPPPKRTGWRYVRGSHAGTFVPDPDGTDVVPKDYTSG